MTSLVFDTTALSHFARADRTDELRIAAAGDEPILLAEVAAELVPELAAFAKYKSELAGGPEKTTERRQCSPGSASTVE